MEHRRVLVIEDDPDQQSLLVKVLELGGYAVTATDGAIGAVGLVRRLQPDLILLDLGLPYRSGASLLAELKVDPATTRIPVLVVSASTESLSDERRTMAAAVISKPISPLGLLKAMSVACPR